MMSAVQIALQIVAVVVLVGVVAGGSERLGWSPPILLVITGVAVSFIPGVPTGQIDPDLILIGLLPPLLYSAAIRTSLVDFRANRQAILLLSVGAVAFTTIVVGLVSWWLTPLASLAACFAIGAVVAPPDAVAASAVARRVGMPRRLVAILEGESLVNDATALVALSVAIAALHHRITIGEVAWRFLLSAGGGIAVGLAVAVILALIRKHITEPVLDTTLSFVAPWLAFLPAEEINASGVLAVVVAGLYLSHRAPLLQTAASRIAENTNWTSIAFVLENAVFLIIGLQLRGLIDRLNSTDFTAVQILLICAVVFLAAVVARIVWAFTGTALTRLLPTATRWAWNTTTVIAWAGMRGVVTLAAAFLLPKDTPDREVLQLAAFAVVGGTLLLQGTTLPWLVRRVGLTGPSEAEDALQAATLRNVATSAALERLEQVQKPEDPPEVIDRLRERIDSEANRMWERLGRPQEDQETPYATYRRIRLEMLDAERKAILRARHDGAYDDEVVRRSMRNIDVEEAMLDRIDDAQARLEEELTTPSSIRGDCDHLHNAPTVVVPNTPGVCEDCLREHTTWVHLRLCLTCGHVGCCDSSVRRHATGHYHSTEHPVMRSIEPGEAWRWCYVDEEIG
jgi:monovalent cation/hydrogen antiporter